MFTVLHSSAGAGKTHALVRHYLALCLASSDPASYRQVLALTFTNKAAGEMKERALRYLEQLAAGGTQEGAMADVLDHLEERTGQPAEVLSLRAAATLRHMLHHWSDVAISTIDTFTRKVVRPFARDLQMDHELRMTTDQEHYLNGAIEALVGEAGDDAEVTGILTEACLQLLTDEQKWDPEGPLRALSKELQKESSLAPLERLKGLDAATLSQLSARLRHQVAAFRNKVRAIGRDALDLLQAEGITAGDMAHGAGGIHGMFRKLAAFDADWDPPGPNALKPLNTGKWHATKARAEIVSALEQLAPELERLFLQAEELRTTGHADHLMRRAVARDLPAVFALEHLDRQLTRLKQDDAVAFFSDLTRVVANVVQDEPVPFIYERMGERYRHFLIDEFQDTSMLQWTCLLPLIDNALGTGGSAFLVGDAKQAIYRWRNGEVRLFVGLPKIHARGHGAVEVQREESLVRNYRRSEPLAHNRRSSPTIISFNNELFGALAEVLPASLRNVYDGHAQRPGGTRPGLVELRSMPKDQKGDEGREAMLAFTSERVHEAITDGYRPGDVAILVRTTAQGRLVAEHLVQQGLNVVSPDGLRLAGDPVVELLVDLLRCLHAQDDTAAARVLQHQARIMARDDAGDVHPFDGGTGLPAPGPQVRRWFQHHGLLRSPGTFTDLLARLCHALGVRPAEEAQVLAFMDEAHSWSIDHGPDLGGFIAHWDGSGSRRSVTPPANGQAVQVMTVHRSKGLEFPVVIVPNACMVTRGDQGERFWVDPRPAVNDLDVALVRDSKALRESGVERLLEEADLRVLDALNLLYVAFTRPKDRLYAMLPERSNDVVSKALLGLLEQRATDGAWKLGERVRAPDHEAPKTVAMLRDVSAPLEANAAAIRMEQPSDWEPEDPDPFRSHGDAVHAVLSYVKVPEDLDQAIETVASTGMLDGTDLPALRQRLAQILQDDRLLPWFGRTLEVRTEATIIDAQGHAQRPDRVVFEGDRARVLDIKTGAPHDGHRDQVLRYMELLQALGHGQVEGALLYIRDGSLQLVEA